VTTIFRVQDLEGRGPFKPGVSSQWVEYRDDYENLIPYFVEFPEIKEFKRGRLALGCGCKTIDQLRRWFNQSEYTTLRILGYHAVIMNVDKILAESDIQCVFSRKRPLFDGVLQVNLYDY
jgi:hypothetical protein